MEFVKNDLLRAFSFPCIIIVFGVVLLVSLFRRVILYKEQRLLSKKLLIELLLSLTVSVALFPPMLQTLSFSIFLPFEQTTSIVESEGVVERIEPCLYRARYYVHNREEYLRANIVTINGVQFFCIGADVLSQEDIISFRYFPNSRMIISFKCQTEELKESCAQKSNTYAAGEVGREYLIYLVILLFCLMIGFVLATIEKHKQKGGQYIRQKICGELFFNHGNNLCLLLILLPALLWIFVPPFKNLTYLEILLPTITFCLIRELPVFLLIDNATISKCIISKSVSLKSFKQSDIQRIVCFCSGSSGLIVFEKMDADVMQCQTLLAFIKYRISHNSDLLFFPVKNDQMMFAQSMLAEQFEKTIQKEDFFSFAFPLIKGKNKMP